MKAAQLIRAAGRTIFSDADTAQLARLNGTVCADPAELASAVDMLLVFGGDGTMLRRGAGNRGLANAHPRHQHRRAWFPDRGAFFGLSPGVAQGVERRISNLNRAH